MYRRYYPRFDRPGEEPQRPIETDVSADTDRNSTVSVTDSSIMTEPEIIIPEKPSHRNEIHTAPALPPVNNATPMSAGFHNLFGCFPNFRRDDILILGLVLMLFLDGVQDEMLLLILVFLFFIGF